MNLNIGCIETLQNQGGEHSYLKMNLNIGCIETNRVLHGHEITLMNLNIGCIETQMQFKLVN